MHYSLNKYYDALLESVSLDVETTSFYVSKRSPIRVSKRRIFDFEYAVVQRPKSKADFDNKKYGISFLTSTTEGSTSFACDEVPALWGGSDTVPVFHCSSVPLFHSSLAQASAVSHGSRNGTAARSPAEHSDGCLPATATHKQHPGSAAPSTPSAPHRTARHWGTGL